MIPTSRTTTYVPGVSEVRSADLNGMQDNIIEQAYDIVGNYWFGLVTPAVGDNASSGDPFHLVWEDTNFNVVSSSANGAFSGRALRIAIPATPSVVGDGVILSPSDGAVGCMVGLDDIVAVQDGYVSMDTIASDTCVAHFGFYEATDSANYESGTFPKVGFRIPMDGTAVQTTKSEGVGAPVNTATDFSPVADVAFRLRVEYHGANTPLGLANASSPVARFYINEDLKETYTGSDIPSGVTPIGPQVGVAAITGDIAAGFYLASLKFFMNPVP